MLRLEIPYNKVDLDNVKSILDYVLLTHKDEVIEYLDEGYPDLIGEWDNYEGGIRGWWGLGSVALCELSLKFTLSYSDVQYIVLTIE